MAIDLTLLNTTISAFMDVGATIINRADVLIGLALIAIVIYIARKFGKGFGDIFLSLTKMGGKKE